jgi:hypothetical protein
MKQLEEIVALCRGEVSLTANPHRSMHQSAAEYLEKDPVTPEALAEVEAGGTLWALQFYPFTPIGFHVLHDSRLERLLDRGLEMMRGATKP